MDDAGMDHAGMDDATMDDATMDEVKAGRSRWFDDDAGRAAAAARRSRDARVPSDGARPVLFVLRMPHPDTSFAWEVRRYTAFVLARGEGYATEALARAAGGRALGEIASPAVPPEG